MNSSTLIEAIGYLSACRSHRTRGDRDLIAFDAREAHYNTLVRYLSLRDCGRVLGYGCGSPSMTKRSQYPEKAYLLGKSL